jgi:peptidoglycan/xylan/chitin deacetylase (PgdA/CDA1 family)
MSRGRANVIRLTAAALYRARLMRPLSVIAGYAASKATFQILSYHRVNDAGDPFFPALPTAVFDQHMRFVSRAYTVLGLETLVARAREGGIPRRAVAITFDDGYRDNLTHAAPILRRHGLPATFFLATGAIGTGEALWFDRLAAAFRDTGEPMLKAPWDEALPLDDEAARLRALERSLAYLKEQPEDRFRAALDRLLDALAPTAEGSLKDLMLSWDEVRTLAAMDFSMGAHTVSHPILSRVTSERAWQEIAESRAMVAAHCGRAPRAFAYPNGKREDYSTAVVDHVRRAGFTCAVTTRFGLNAPRTSPWELRRGGPWEHDVATFALKLAGMRLGGLRTVEEN